MSGRLSAALFLATAACSFHVDASNGVEIDAPSTGCKATDWTDAAWASRVPLAIDHARVTGTPGDITVLVVLAIPELSRAKPSADDLRFTTADGTVLPRETERFDPATGAVVAWVRVPNLSSAADTPLYLYFENPAPPPPSTTGVWPDYLAVWHFREDPGVAQVQIKDSTANVLDLTPQGMQPGDRIDGRAGFGLRFDGVNNGLTRTPFTIPAVFTFEAWIRPTQLGGFKAVFDNVAHNRWFGLYGDDLNFWDNQQDRTSATTVTTDAWHAITAAYNGTALSVSFDGAPLGPPATFTMTNVNSPFEVGFSPVGEWFAGTIDELRIGSTARTADAIATSYANESSPEKFVTPSTVEACR